MEPRLGGGGGGGLHNEKDREDPGGTPISLKWLT